MNRGIEIDIELAAGTPNANFIAEALGNLAGFDLQQQRGEPLEWQVLRIEESHHHHFRLAIRHPARPLDLGLTHALRATLAVLARETPDELRTRLRRAEGQGLRLTRLRHLHEAPDLWQDDFWNWMG